MEPEGVTGGVPIATTTTATLYEVLPPVQQLNCKVHDTPLHRVGAMRDPKTTHSI